MISTEITMLYTKKKAGPGPAFSLLVYHA